MKLVKKKTRKAIEKTVRKAMKKHGPALMASLVSSLAASIATLAQTEAPGRSGTSNLGQLVEDAKSAVTGDSGRKRSRDPQAEKKRKIRPTDQGHRALNQASADASPAGSTM